MAEESQGEDMLPEAFLERMEQLLGGEYGAFLESYSAERLQGLRLNPGKIGLDGCSAAQKYGTGASGQGGAEVCGAGAADGNALARETGRDGGFAHLEKVPWAKDGYYYRASDQPGKHPFHEAGLYYIQEPSAMAPAELLDVRPGERVLDLCAAPGGKSTQIAARLCGSGFLLCNEIHPARAKILSENIERMGIGNACVTNEVPERLAEVFPEYFDCILVDAPCSGEGMFRKNEEACGEWNPENVRLCAGRQDGILDCAARMLRPGGRLVYSTCTFAPEEDEGSIGRFLRRQEGFRIAPVDKAALGLAGCDGMPDALARLAGCAGMPDMLAGSAGCAGMPNALAEPMRGLQRLGRDGAEPGRKPGRPGHDAAESGREPGRPGHDAAEPERECQRPGYDAAEPGREPEGTGCGVGESEGGAGSHLGQSADDLRQTLRLWPHRIKGEGHFAAVLIKDGDMPDGYRNIETNRAKNRMPAKEIVPEEFMSFCAENLIFSPTGLKESAEGFLSGLGRAAGMEGSLRYVQFGGNLYMVPGDMPSLNGLKVLRPGLHLGEMKKNRFEPSHALALALRPACAAHVWNLDPDDSRVCAYLNGQTFPAEGEKGWYLICVDGFSIGWGKLAGNLMKNHYPRGLRKA